MALPFLRNLQKHNAFNPSAGVRQTPLADARVLSGVAIAWVGLSALQWYITTEIGAAYLPALIEAAICNALLMALCLVSLNTLRYYRPNVTLWEGLFKILIYCLILGYIWVWLVGYCLNQLPPPYALQHSVFRPEEKIIGTFLGFIILVLNTVAGLLWYKEQENQEADNRRQDLEKLAKEAELSSLQLQLQPHFLFNSLNSISALVVSQPKQAREMVNLLSDFLRGTLKKRDSDISLLSQELDQLELFLAIEKVRYGERLRTSIIADNACLNSTIPYLLLQPILENAIKFGLYDVTGEVAISIICQREDRNMLSITVTNPFDSRTANAGKGTGFGLDGIKRRLYLLFGRQDLVRTHFADNIFYTTVYVPQLASLG